MKRLTILTITIFLIYFIYSLFNVNKLNYVSITDHVLFNYNDYIKDYLLINNRISNFNNYFICDNIEKLYQDIKNNRTINVNNDNFYIKKVLRESDILVISVGMEELKKSYSKYDMKINDDYFNKLYFNIERVIKEIKKYAYGKVIFIGYYNPTNYYDANIDRFFYDINIKLNKLMMNNNIIYLDLYETVKENKNSIKTIVSSIIYYLN